jgi:hypothetical protein
LESRRLCIPIYLNQRTVFDLLAIVEGGFSQLQTVKSNSANEKSSSFDASTEVGSKNVFSFLNLGLKGEFSREGKRISEQEIQEERVFTPASLFSRLRDSLIKTELLKILDSSFSGEIKAGDFVEFSGIFHKNPMVGVMEGVIQMMETALLFTGTVNNKSKSKMSPEKEVLLQMKKFLDTLTQAGYLDLVTQIEAKQDLNAVVPVQLEYFQNQSPADIIDGKFVILGKVVRYLPDRTSGAINLLRGTPLSYLPKENLHQVNEAFLQVLSQLAGSEEFITQIEAPVLLIVPIAIYA